MSAVDTKSTLVSADLAASISAQLEAYTRYITGNQLGVILAVKGIPGAAESAGLPAFSGVDGAALEKAFVALGWGQQCWLGVMLRPSGAPRLDAMELRRLIEIVDPLVVVSLDEFARLTLIESFSSTETGLLASFLASSTEMVLGRRFVSIDGFEASLADAQKKQLAWAQLKEAERP